jgi:Asp-tRNA(Asn)/Glu-tRNA(Gln) amidotransferase A subunit family amidase
MLATSDALCSMSGAEQAVMANEVLGPLDGVPVSIKDLIATRGIRTVSGSVAYADLVPDEDDVVVERLKSAGAILLGKTNISEFGYMADRFDGEMLPSLVELLRKPWTAEEFSNAAMARQAVANTMWRFMRGYDFLIAPTLAVAAFDLELPGPATIDGEPFTPAHWLSFTAATVPAGWTEDGLPVGLQIIGKHLVDPMVLKASAAFELAQPCKDRWPPLVATT